MAHLLDGRALAARLRSTVKEQISHLARPPRLAAILVGDDPASRLYVSLKEKAAAEVGLGFEKLLFPANVVEETLLQKIRELNERPDVDAALVQLPLPPPLDAERVIAAIAPSKDADGFHPDNLAAMRSGRPFTLPGVTEGIIRLIEESGQALAGKTALVLANSEVFALPLALALTARSLQAQTLLKPFERQKTIELGRKSAVIVTALGEPGYITGEMVADGAVLIDVGTTRLPDGKVVGDVRSEDFASREVWLTPVPGGVGPVTVAMLLLRVTELASSRQGELRS